MRKLGEVLETVVIVVILAALVHTFLEDIATIGLWPSAARTVIVWLGLGFDLFFTFEFFTRLYLALAERRGMDYFFRQRGWIDFLASIPLLLFSSLPNALALLAGAGLVSGLGSFLNVLKVIKAVRIARILRLLRVIKLFRGIRYARSVLVQNHIAMITTISVTLIVLSSLGAAALEGAGVLPGLEGPFLDGQALRARSLAADATASAADATASAADATASAADATASAAAGPGSGTLAQRAAAAAAIDPTLLLVRPLGGVAAWSRFDGPGYARSFLPGDYGYIAINGIEVFTDERPRAQSSARESLVFFVAVLLTLLGYLLIYAPRFALGITDPLYVMKRGMSEPGYNLQVKIPPEHSDDDVFQLAALYNSVYLPLKDREQAGGQSAGTSLRIDDIKDLVDQGE
jgi:hypothetical protein